MSETEKVSIFLENIMEGYWNKPPEMGNDFMFYARKAKDRLVALAELTDNLQKQSDLLTLGLLQEKVYISAIREQFSKSVSATQQAYYPKAICENLPPEQFSGFNACLSCPMLETCRLLYKNQ